MTTIQYLDEILLQIQTVKNVLRPFTVAKMNLEFTLPGEIQKLMFILLAILTVCTIHLVLFIIKWICDARNKRKDKTL